MTWTIWLGLTFIGITFKVFCNNGLSYPKRHTSDPVYVKTISTFYRALNPTFRMFCPLMYIGMCSYRKISINTTLYKNAINLDNGTFWHMFRKLRIYAWPIGSCWTRVCPQHVNKCPLYNTYPICIDGETNHVWTHYTRAMHFDAF